MVIERDLSSIYVTGMAWTNALGSDLDQVWAKLLEGRTGMVQVPSPHPVRNTLAAVIPDLPLDMDPNERMLTLMSKTLRRALEDAGLRGDQPDIRYVFGTSYGAHLDDPETSSLHQWAVEAARELGACHPPLSLTTACSYGSDSILVAAELIRQGVADIVVCGGADLLTNSKRLGHTGLGTMSPHLLRAFDERHDGMLLGEGAGFLVMESKKSAKRRDARIHAEFMGAGSSNDAFGMTAPDMSGESIVMAVQRALKVSKIECGEIAVINAHGSGTPVNDAVEATSFARLFDGADRLPVVIATKGALGHSLGATGVLEVMTVVLALRDQRVPPIYGLEQRVPDFAMPLPIREPLSIEGSIGISLTLGFGGFNTCLVFKAIA